MIKVLKFKDLIKYVFITGILIVLIMTMNTIKSNAVLFNCLDSTILELGTNEKENNNKNQQIYKTVISSELKLRDNLKENSKEQIDDMNNSMEGNDGESNSTISETKNLNNTNTEDKSIEKVDENAKVSEINNSGISPKTTNDYHGVKINNGTDYNLTDEMLNPDVNINKKKIGIYHTHTCESYTTSEKYNYEQNGNYRTTDLNFTVARVGDELTEQLQLLGCNVIHNKNYHDYPAYTGSYSRSLKTAEEIANENKDIDIMIDLHRDAIGDENYAPKVKIGNEYASQLMFVMGSNVANSINSNWNQNLKFSIKVQEKANELYPGLFKPIILRNSEYNQHISKAACIIEVGATGNTLDESINSMKYLAKIIEEI